MEYTPDRGLGIACNTLRMLVYHFFQELSSKRLQSKKLLIDLRNEFIFLFVDGSIHPKKNDGKLHHCA
jgi:hypothetical protein